MRWGHKPEQPASPGVVRRSTRDDATGLLTYAAFVHECREALTAHIDPGTAAQPAVLLIDIDGIHTAVDTDGHAASSEVMSLVSSRVRREVGSLGVLARMSDQQIGVLFAHLPAPAVALDIAYRIVTAVSLPLTLENGRRLTLSLSCGMATRDSVGVRPTAMDLMRGAGLAVREARRSGRNRIEVCTPELVAVADETITIGKDLRQALQENGLRVCYQPIVDLHSGAILGFEALVRWTHVVHGHVSPARFVPVAEQFGLSSELGRMVLSTAAAQIQQWSTAFGVPLDAHVNVSGIDLAKDTFVEMVEECLTASSLPAGQLVLEVTELAVEPDPDTARERFVALHELGVRIALDDFGTGRSALAYLQTLPVDILKVDRHLLETESENSATRADDLLRGVIAFGQALGMTVYGEGIEDEEQQEHLRDNGCEIGQGYLFAKPLPAEDAAAMLRAQVAPVDSLARRIMAAKSASGSS